MDRLNCAVHMLDYPGVLKYWVALDETSIWMFSSTHPGFANYFGPGDERLMYHNT